MAVGEMIGSDWRVFFDGVEVPHQGVSINFEVDQISQAQVMLEPDRLLANLRPQTVVSIWTKDRFNKGQRVQKSLDEQLKNEYSLYWEGLTTGLTHSKSTTERSMMVSCEGLIGPFSRIGGFTLNLGRVANSELVTGSFLPTVATSTLGDVNLIQLTADAIAADGKTSMSRITFGALTTLLAYNGIGRLQERRYQLLSRITVVENATLAALILPSAGASPFRGIVHSQDLGPTATVFDVIRQINSYVFYRLVQVPSPTPVDLKDGFARLDLKDTDAPANERFVATFRRNEYLSLPDMYFTAPPPCNFVFPDMLTSLKVSRRFYREPTRTALVDPLTGGAAIYLAPSVISPSNNLTSAEVFSYIPQQQVIESAYSNYPSAYSINLQANGDQPSRAVKSLANITSYEIEKGIVMQVLQPDVSSVYAQALRLDPTNESSATERQATAYDLFLKGVADFRHELARLNRTIQVSMVGHRNLVPGFTAVIFDTDASYMGYVETCSFTVDPSGRESTQVSLSRGRPLPTGNMESVQEKVFELITALKDGDDILLDNAVDALTYGGDDAEELKEATLTVTKFQTTLYRALAPTLELLDLPFPLFTGGLALDSPAALDKLYGELLGCKPFYTGPYMPKAPKPDRTLDFLVGPLLTLIRAIQGLDAVYESNPNRDRSGLPQSYQQKAGNQTIGQGTFEWQHTNFLERNRLYMGRYLEEHGLNLAVRSATAGIKVAGVEPRRFAVMQPADPGKKRGSLLFDSTLFCKLPEDGDLMRAELADKGRGDSGIREAQSNLGSSGGLDKELLTTAGRQKFILNYSNKHFGSRAFDGS